MTSLFVSFLQLVLKVKQQFDVSCCWVCHGRFHGVLPKEHPGTFYGFHGDYIKGYLLTLLASQMLELIQLISEIKYIVTAANVLLSTHYAFAVSYAAF
jgi:hypothetical protein